MKHFVRTIIWTVFTVYLCLFALLRLSAVQTVIADYISDALSQKLGTNVSAKNIDIRLFNRVIVDDLTIYDQHNKRMLCAGRVSATIELMPLFDGKISISSAQLFGIKANIYRNDATSPLNCQFVIDSLRSKDTTSSTPLNLHIASLIIRNSSISYDQWDKPTTNGKFSPYHIHLSQFSSHIILSSLTDDTVDASLKRLSFHEASGLHVKDITADVNIKNNNLSFNNVTLVMPHTRIAIPYVSIAYSKDGDKIRKGSMKFKAKLEAHKISPTDFSPLLPNGDASTLPIVSVNATMEGTDTQSHSTISLSSISNNDITISLSAIAQDILENPHGDLLVSNVSVSETFINKLSHVINLPDIFKKTGDINIHGRVKMFDKAHFTANTTLVASRIGKADINARYNDRNIVADIKTPNMDIMQLTDDKRFGNLRCDVNVKAQLSENNKLQSAAAKGNISEFTYNSYTYRNATIDLNYASNNIGGTFIIRDPNINLSINGKATIGAHKSLNATIEATDICPSAINLTHQFGSDHFTFNIRADINGSNINNIAGSISLNNVCVTNANSKKQDAYLDHLTASITANGNGEKEMTLTSDFANISMQGKLNVTTLVRGLRDIVEYHIPALRSNDKKRYSDNEFTFDGNIDNITFLKRIVNIPVDLDKPINFSGYVNCPYNSCSISLSAPSLKVSNTQLENTEIELWTASSTIRSIITSTLIEKNGPVSLSLENEAGDNELRTVMSWDNMRQNIFRGRINILSQFMRNTDNSPRALVTIPHSSFEVGDTVWSVHSSGIDYTDGKLSVNRLAIENPNQHLYVNGTASRHAGDSITAELKNINIGYILDLVNFHSVEFDGWASGVVNASSVLSSPTATAQLNVRDFQFEHGHLGDLTLNAGYDHTKGLIELNGGTPTLALQGNVSPAGNSIDLQMDLSETPMEFMSSFCGSFLHNIDLHGSGDLRLHGPFNGLELEGQIVANGGLTLSSTNCRYTMENDTISFIPGDIRFNNAILKDRFGNAATLTGGVHHRHLGRISYDLTAKTKKLLAYDFPTLKADETYCGYARINGEIGVHGKGNEVHINADCTALPGSFFCYDASSPEALKSQDFITWGSANDTTLTSKNDTIHNGKKGNMEQLDAGNDRANIRLDFMVNVTPDSRLNLIMDKETGDYVNLFGSGALHIQFYNKGSLDIFGNYGIEHGTYKMTIQNLMRRDFTFQRGGNIAFTGDPYNAILNLQAAYVLNSVSLADLNIGSSFKSNNVPVKCLMDITGTPEKPKIDFGLDLPSLSSDARQMVYSVINSAEEMNQQVLYLLAVGRFLSQTNDEENTQRTKQSTLAMQSFLSGTLSQQLSNVLGHVTGNTNWTVGANITPGADGFNNGVYEGLLSGRMFNNRLLFNGQFGYRDNINTNTQSFIGDFTLQYLLTPNGSFSLKMYNQTNDRYFTKSSLNTQGIGIVIQKEFGK